LPSQDAGAPSFDGEKKLSAVLKRAGRRADLIWLKLAKVHPLKYIFYYCISIFVFAIIYDIMSKENFYAPYAHFEKPYLDAQENFRAYMEEVALTHSLQIKIRQEDERNGALGDWNRERTSVSFGRIDGLIVNTDKTIEMDSFFHAKIVEGTMVDDSPTARRKPETVLELFCHLRFKTNERWLTIPENGGPLESILKMQYKPTEACTQATIDLLFVHSPDYPNTFGVFISEDAALQAISLVQGMNGEPTSVGGNFPRMLYFSIVVLTTLGLGDIVPMTPIARLAVGTEAVLGVSLLGFLLNAIAWRANNSSREEQATQRSSSEEPAHREPVPTP
jgi:hypothetical protein